MSSVIKLGVSGSDGKVRPLRASLPLAQPPQSSTEPDERTALQEQVRKLEEIAEAQRKAMERHRDELAAAFDKGHAEGHKRGLAEAESRERERLSLLKEGMLKALSSFQQRMAQAETLGVLVAQTSLDKIFGEMHGKADTVFALIKAQIDKAGAAQILDVRVSCEDFASLEGSSGVELDAALRGTQISRDPKLRSGECVMRLLVGEAEIGLDTQWGSLRTLLENWSGQREGAEA